MSLVCNVCGHSDCKVVVRSSYLGPFSISICRVCLLVGAESYDDIKIIEELNGPLRWDVVYYETITDTYKYFYSNKIVYVSPNKSIKTRQDMLSHFIKS